MSERLGWTKFTDKLVGTIGSFQLRADLYTPSVTPPGAGFPVVLWVHGGGWSSGDKGQLNSFFKQDRDALLAQGFRIIAMDYRHVGLDAAFVWPAMIEDVKATVRWAKMIESNDDTKIYGLGPSSGAQLVALACVTSDSYHNNVGPHQSVSGKLRAGVGYFGGYDLWTGAAPQWLLDQPGAIDAFGGGSGTQALLEDASAIDFVTGTSNPFAMWHGDSDDAIPRTETDNMHTALTNASVVTQKVIVVGGEHQWNPDSGTPNKATVAVDAAAWLAAH